MRILFPAARLTFEELESRGREIGVEGERDHNLAAPHHQKADVIDQAYAARCGSLQFADAGGVQMVVYPFDDERLRILRQLGRRREAQTRLDQSDGLHEHVIVCQQLIPVVQNRL